jgi:restriction endonuclease S subunit
MILLKDLVKIKSGVFAKPQSNPRLFYIQASDFDLNREWKENLIPTLDFISGFEKHIIQLGDILFVSKGREFFAISYDGRYSPAVASSTFLVLKVDETKLIPEFLVWFLNHPKTNLLLQQLSRGSSLPMISKSILGEIEIPILSLEEQQKIITIDVLKKREEILQLKINALKDNYFNELTYRILQKN